MWPYNDEENGWLGQNVAHGTSAGPAHSPREQSYLPDYYRPETVPVTPEMVAFYQQRARKLRHAAIGGFFTRLAASAAGMFQQLGQLSSGNHAKIEAVIADMRRQAATPRNAGTAGR
ncbi:MAG: hypothetical protein IPK59_10965 [Rhodospirillaceae bacterium]|nr:hypothetical protein [Rhodospirillaceae bacterium]